MQNSTGTLDVQAAACWESDKIVKSTINVINGTNVSVTATINGFDSTISSSTLMQIFDQKTYFQPKSFTLIYIHNATQSKYRKISIGQRQTGDKLLTFESKNVTISNRFAETEFEFENESTYLTYVGFSFSVSIKNVVAQVP